MKPNILKENESNVAFSWNKKRFALGAFWGDNVLQIFVGPLMIWIWLGECRNKK